MSKHIYTAMSDTFDDLGNIPRMVKLDYSMDVLRTVVYGIDDALRDGHDNDNIEGLLCDLCDAVHGSRSELVRVAMKLQQEVREEMSRRDRRASDRRTIPVSA